MAKRRTIVLCIATLAAIPAARASADTERAMAVHPWAEGAWGETNDRLLYQAEGNVKGEDNDAQVFWWDSYGRFRFDKADEHPLSLGYHWATMDFSTHSTTIPNHLDDISLAAGIPLITSDAGWTSIVLGAGYASDTPFADINGLYGVAHLVHEAPLGKDQSLFLTLDYNGNSPYLPDVPLPGVTWVKRAGDDLTFGLGFPDNWVAWRFAPQWTLSASYEVPYTADVRLEYNFTKTVSVFGDYANFFHSFYQDDQPTTDRVFYEMSRAEVGIRYNGKVKGFDVDAAFVIGYAFEQNFYDGFDVRNLNETGSISDEPYIGIQLLSRF